jgi:hypothetical protein
VKSRNTKRDGLASVAAIRAAGDARVVEIEGLGNEEATSIRAIYDAEEQMRVESAEKCASLRLDELAGMGDCEAECIREMYNAE